MEAAPPLLTIERLSMRFGGLLAVDEVSFVARKGEITALIGPNGAGKTTVFNCATGFYKPTSGRLLMVHGTPPDAQRLDHLTRTGHRVERYHGGSAFLLERMPDHEIAAAAGVARTFQNIRLFSGMTVLENLIVARHNALMRASGLTILGLIGAKSFRDAEDAAIADAAGWLDRIGLRPRADDPAGDLPYGDQRRLEIARAMMTGPRLLCLDEPAAGLNPRESAELTRLVRSIRDDDGVSVLLIEHDMSVVMEISDHIVVLEYGRRIADGTADEIKNDPKVIAAYLGVEDEEVAALTGGIAP